VNSKKHGLKDQNLNLTKKRKTCNLGLFFSVSLIVFVVSLSFFYIFNITSSATSGFKISEQEQKVFELKLANESLRNKIQSYEDLEYVRKKATDLGLVIAQQINYLEVLSSGVAALK